MTGLDVLKCRKVYALNRIQNLCKEMELDVSKDHRITIDKLKYEVARLADIDKQIIRLEEYKVYIKACEVVARKKTSP